METRDFDQLVKQLANKEHDLHQSDLERSRSKVWNAIQTDLPKAKVPIRRYLLAAAIIIILFGFGTVLIYQLNRNHREQMNMLQAEIKELQKEEHDQIQQLDEKEEELSNLKQQLSKLSMEMEKLQIQDQGEAKYLVREIIHRDTVYIKQIEYKASEVEPEMEGAEEMALKPQERSSKKEFDLIYPSVSKQNKPTKSPSALTIKVGAFNSN